MEIRGPMLEKNERNLAYWINRPQLSAARKAELLQAQVLLWPILSDPPFEEGGFFLGTRELLKYLRQHLAVIRLEVCAEDEKSCEWVVDGKEELVVMFWAILSGIESKSVLEQLCS